MSFTIKLILFLVSLAVIGFAIFFENLWRHRKGKNPVKEAIEDIADLDVRNMKKIKQEQVEYTEKIEKKSKSWKKNIEKTSAKQEDIKDQK